MFNFAGGSIGPNASMEFDCPSAFAVSIILNLSITNLGSNRAKVIAKMINSVTKDVISIPLVMKPEIDESLLIDTKIFVTNGNSLLLESDTDGISVSISYFGQE